MPGTLTDWDGILLTAHRYWPHREDKRQDLLRACFPRFLAEKQRLFPLEYATLQFWQQSSRVCQALGGWEALADAPRYSAIKAEIAEAVTAGTWIGIGLTLGEQLIRQGYPPELVSINRIAYLLEEFGQYLLKASISQDAFMRAWKRYKDAAPLWAAYLAASGWWNRGGPQPPPEDWRQCPAWFQSQMLEQYSYAQTFYRFGTTFRAKGSRGPLLDPETTWEVRAEVEGPAFELPPMHPVIRKALEGYRTART